MAQTQETNKKQTIGIVGLGLIGASLSMALRPFYHVAGCSRRRETEAYALEHGVIDEVRPVEKMRGVQCVAVCTPLKSLRQTVQEVYAAVGDSAIITDVGSVKSVLEGLDGRIVGGHPMAGNERNGIYAAKADLFAGATYCVVPYADSTESDVAFVEQMAAVTGAHPWRISAQDHDRMAAMFSHMPHLSAYALCSAVRMDEGRIAGSGFIDSTRIAASDPDFWTEVFRLNRDNVLKAADEYGRALDALRTLLYNEDYDGLRAALERAQGNRKELMRCRRKRDMQ